jgi:hypothetical protein
MSAWPAGGTGFTGGRENAAAFDEVARNIDRRRWNAQVTHA